jgi:2-isopropylmalate synthase
LALDLFSHGIDPQLDFSSIDDVRRTVERCNEMPVHARHPYVGDLVYTAFSGTHQDAIAKGFTALETRAAETGTSVRDLPWEVPYLPIDPQDVGRSYESVVRVNSQSGKGGLGHVLKNVYGLDLPRDVRVEFARCVQGVADREGTELSAERLLECFQEQYLPAGPRLVLRDFTEEARGEGTSLRLVLVTGDGQERRLSGSGTDSASACCDALSALGLVVRPGTVGRPTASRLAGRPLVAFSEVRTTDLRVWGVGLAATATGAVLQSVVNAVNRLPDPMSAAGPVEPIRGRTYADHR